MTGKGIIRIGAFGMGTSSAWKVGFLTFSILGLASCEEGKPVSLFSPRPAAEGTSGQEASGVVVERDVESPEVFSSEGPALWDGRPSLGGIWVAHPDATEPQRVMIRNKENGKFVIGALFGRERDVPGPKLQVSSDAAAELGMLAGAPSDVSVVAIIREAVNVTPDLETPDANSDGSIETTTIDAVASLAASAIDASEAPSTKPVPRPGTQSASSANSPAPKPTAAPSRSTGSLEKPYIQVGIFSVKANADQTAELLRNSGVIPAARPFTSNGKDYWRIVVGPVSSVADRRAILKKLDGLGFGDAYPVTN